MHRAQKTKQAKTTSLAVVCAALQQQTLRDLNVNFIRTKDGRPPPRKAGLTLAQQIGLVEKPAPKLTDQEWNQVRMASQVRQDSELPCPICQEDFKINDQVLLDCSHVFHKVCLRNFELFSGTRTCPICRHKDYQKKAIDDGTSHYRKACATKIQATWRGYRARRIYKHMKETIPPSDPEKRREFYMRKFERASENLHSLMEAKDSAIDALFAELDQNVASSRAMLLEAETSIALKAVDWSNIMQQAEERNVTDCPICMCAFRADKAQVLLSCSHVFHEQCLSSFEMFNMHAVRGCPICRATYHKIQYPTPTNCSDHDASCHDSERMPSAPDQDHKQQEHSQPQPHDEFRLPPIHRTRSRESNQSKRASSTLQSKRNVAPARNVTASTSTRSTRANKAPSEPPPSLSDSTHAGRSSAATARIPKSGSKAPTGPSSGARAGTRALTGANSGRNAKKS